MKELTEQLSWQRLRDPAVWLEIQRHLRLSPRELDVAILLMLGNSLNQIARRLDIEKTTADTYVKRLRRKTKSRSRPEILIRLLIAGGLMLDD